ncbi:MAG: hypothetical protein ACI9W2_004639 [Gammaproteobacteria bacterium]|jgi:hypothetical protein
MLKNLFALKRFTAPPEETLGFLCALRICGQNAPPPVYTSRMLSKIFSNTELDTFAKSLAAELVQRYPVELHRVQSSQSLEKKTQKRMIRALESIYARAREYRVQHPLGVYKKARLGNTFQWELKETGYSEAFVDETTKGLVLSLSAQ